MDREQRAGEIAAELVKLGYTACVALIPHDIIQVRAIRGVYTRHERLIVATLVQGTQSIAWGPEWEWELPLSAEASAIAESIHLTMQ